MTLVIGLGNPMRGDDGAGLAVAALVKAADVHQSMTGSFELIDVWEGHDDVVIVDATASGAAPGSILRIDACREPLPTATFASTHVIGIAETVELARRLDRLPRSLRVIGIEAGDLTEGTKLSPLVEEAVASVARELDHA